MFPVTGSQLQLLPRLLQLRRARGAVRGAARQRRGARTRLDGGRAQRRDGGSLPQKINVLLMKIFEQKYFLTFDLPDTLLLTPEPPHTSAEI